MTRCHSAGGRDAYKTAPILTVDDCNLKALGKVHMEQTKVEVTCETVWFNWLYMNL